MPLAITSLCFHSIFGYQDDAADDIIYINWLNMVRAGLVGLEFYTPENNKWRQVSYVKSVVVVHVTVNYH